LKEEVVFLVVGMDTDFVFGFHDRLTFEKSSKSDIFVTVYSILLFCCLKEGRKEYYFTVVMMFFMKVVQYSHSQFLAMMFYRFTGLFSFFRKTVFY
jgi:hypothetical protein